MISEVNGHQDLPLELSLTYRICGLLFVINFIYYWRVCASFSLSVNISVCECECVCWEGVGDSQSMLMSDKQLYGVDSLLPSRGFQEWSLGDGHQACAPLFFFSLSFLLSCFFLNKANVVLFCFLSDKLLICRADITQREHNLKLLLSKVRVFLEHSF